MIGWVLAAVLLGMYQIAVLLRYQNRRDALVFGVFAVCAVALVCCTQQHAAQISLAKTVLQFFAVQ